jgi:hypothetical protein
MAFRLPDRWGCVGLLAFLVVPGLVLAYLLHSPWWIAATPLGLIILMLAVAALPSKRKITPQKWADELEKHLLGTDGPYDWDDATSVTLADPQLENLRSRLCHDFNQINTPEKREEFRQIIDALRRGEIP